ncbi:DUF3592 domain-containing protein [Massilia sp.]|uniref:DUF3592 domain-containing protein n=1 Tax=Massilia sp. TaxID=1882437 RepID=UPI0028981DA7|nr:DUF3592 domain-containing protein [Massilia sp.]
MALVAWLCVCALPVWKIMECAGEIVRGRASLGWQAAPGRIVYAELRAHGKGGKMPAIGYSYRAGGRTWAAHQIEATSGYSPPQATKLVERFPPGAEVTVYHDGQGEAVLIRGVRASSWFGHVLSLLWLWGVLAVTWYEAARFVARRRIPGA